MLQLLARKESVRYAAAYALPNRHEPSGMQMYLGVVFRLKTFSKVLEPNSSKKTFLIMEYHHSANLSQIKNWFIKDQGKGQPFYRS